MDRAEILRSCTRFFGQPPRTVKAQLADLADAASDDEYPDRYAGGDLLESFEREIAELLGTEAAVFMPSGTMAQQIALRVHCDRRATRNVALHPKSHLLISENDAIQRLHNIAPITLGPRDALYSLDDLKAVPEKLGAVLLELPERNIGGALRPWSALAAICEWTRASGIAMHLDGARLWESQHFYDRPLAEIVALFDTAYVSFYKILNGIAGAALLGPKDFIDEARGWQWRHGGRLVQQFPTIVSAREGLRRYLPRVPEYCKRAREIATVASGFKDVVVTPNPPPTNMMHIYVRGELDRLQEAALNVSRESGVWFASNWNATQLPGWQMFELACGEGSLELSDEDVRTLFARLLSQTN